LFFGGGEGRNPDPLGNIEIRSTKFETSTNHQNTNDQDGQNPFGKLGNLDLDIVSDFEIRIY